MKIFRFVVLLLSSAVLPGLTSAGDDPEPEWGKITDRDWAATAPDDYPDANAVILFEEGEIDIKLEFIELKRHVRIKILSEAGIKEASDWSVLYHKDDKLKEFEAQLFTPAGDKHKVKGDDEFEREFGDFRERGFVFSNVEVGSVIEFKYKVRTERFFFLEPWYFQNELYTTRSRVKVTLPPGFDYDVRFSNIPHEQREPEVEEEACNSRYFSRPQVNKIFTWEMKDLLPIRDEPYMSHADDYRASMRFQLMGYRDMFRARDFFKNWSFIGQVFEIIFKAFISDADRVKSLAAKITEGIDNPRDQSRVLHAYVASEFETVDNNTEFIAGYDGEVRELLDRNSGTPLEKNLLLLGLHRSLGMNAWPVLLSTRDRARFDPDSPHLTQFNYLVVFVQFGEDWEFLDASSAYYPYGLLPPDCHTNGGFLVDGKESDLVRITARPADSRRVDTTRVYIGADGSVICSTRTICSGYLACEYGHLYEKSVSDDFIEARYTDHLERSCDVLEAKCVSDTGGKFQMEVTLTADDLMQNLDGNQVISIPSFQFRTNPFKNQQRFTPIDFVYPFLCVNVVEIIPPDTSATYELPAEMVYEIDGASFGRSSEVRGSRAYILTSLAITAPEFGRQEYDKVKKFFDRVEQAQHEEVVLLSDEVSSGAQ